MWSPRHGYGELMYPISSDCVSEDEYGILRGVFAAFFINKRALQMGPVTISTCLNSKYLYFWIELESKAVELSVGQLGFQGLLVSI